MLIVLEGMPGAGKTTLLQELQKDKRVNPIKEILHDESKYDNEDKYVQQDIEKYSRILKDKINIMDRNYISTLCYNYCSDEIFGTNNYARIKKKIDEAISQNKLYVPDLYVVLVCSVNCSILRQNIGNDLSWKSENFLHVALDYYQNKFNQNHGEVIIINTEEIDIAQTNSIIKEAIGEINEGLIKL